VKGDGRDHRSGRLPDAVRFEDMDRMRGHSRTEFRAYPALHEDRHELADSHVLEDIELSTYSCGDRLAWDCIVESVWEAVGQVLDIAALIGFDHRRNEMAGGGLRRACEHGHGFLYS
jgi:hypothetical protein